MSVVTAKDVGVIGLGIIGSRVAGNLARKGFNVYVWNRTARPLPGFVASPHELAEAREHLGVRAGHPARGVTQTVAVGVLAERQQQLTHRPLGAGEIDPCRTGVGTDGGVEAGQRQPPTGPPGGGGGGGGGSGALRLSARLVSPRGTAEMTSP